jgi:hypothetical protein
MITTTQASADRGGHWYRLFYATPGSGGEAGRAVPPGRASLEVDHRAGEGPGDAVDRLHAGDHQLA